MFEMTINFLFLKTFFSINIFINSFFIINFYIRIGRHHMSIIATLFLFTTMTKPQSALFFIFSSCMGAYRDILLFEDPLLVTTLYATTPGYPLIRPQ